MDATEQRASDAVRHPLDWRIVGILVAVHTGALSCVVVPPTRTALLLFACFHVLGVLGITIGFHRYLAHRAFECPFWLRCILTTLGTAALQGGPIFWVGLHRRHHQFGDRPGDPHSPQGGLLHAHVLWMTRPNLKIGAELILYFALMSNDLRALSRERYLKWLDRGIGPLVPWAVTLGICALVGGLPGFVWGGLVRTLTVWHSIWIVNSVGHRFGRQPHATLDDSRNVWWLTPFALGDNWHNNHHAMPRVAVVGPRWWYFDVSGMIILALEKMGLARDLVRRKRAVVRHETAAAADASS